MNRFYVANELGDGEAEMFLFGTIGDDLNCEEFVRELRDLAVSAKTIYVRINSGGGSVFDGLAIYGALKKCPAMVIGKIDGLCASMATICALGMDKVYMSRNAQFMTHKASGYAMGSSDEIKTYAAMIDNLENVMADVYANKTGLTTEEVKGKFLRSDDSWFTAQQALDAKLIDGIYDPENGEAVGAPATMKNQQEVIAYYNNFFSNNTPTMKQFLLSASQLAALNLTAGSEPAAVSTAVDALIAKAGKVDQLQAQLNEAVQAKATADTDLANLKKTSTEARVDALLDKALNQDKKITAQVKVALREQYLTNPDGLEKLLAAMTPILSVTNNLKEEETDKRFAGKSYAELDKAGLLEELKAKHPETFKTLYKEQYGTEYKK